MNLTKCNEIFDYNNVKDTIHLIGCGAVGSAIAEMLARFGITNVVLYDFDTVESKNINNQMFFNSQIGANKAEATKEIMMAINPECKNVITKPEGWNGQQLNGHVIIAVDSIDLRNRIFDECKYNIFIKSWSDYRMGLYDGQHYCFKWNNEKVKNNYKKTMNFKDEDVQEVRSACHETISFAPTIRSIVSVGFANWVKMLKEEQFKWFIIMNCWTPEII